MYCKLKSFCKVKEAMQEESANRGVEWLAELTLCAGYLAVHSGQLQHSHGQDNHSHSWDNNGQDSHVQVQDSHV
jgi:hypothetical protein